MELIFISQVCPQCTFYLDRCHLQYCKVNFTFYLIPYYSKLKLYDMIRCEHCHTGHKKQNKHEPSSLSLSLSFEDICPQWNNALITRFSNDSRLNILEAKYCIVGEAHGFRNSTYICSKCWEYSQSFTHCVYGSRDYDNYSITDHILFEHLKENFIEHFNQSHVRKKGLRRAIKVWIWKAHKVSIKLFMCKSGLNHEEMEDILYT
jgi:hypothetical protein